MLKLELIVLGIVAARTLPAAVGGPQIGFGAALWQRLTAIAVGKNILVRVSSLRREDGGGRERRGGKGVFMVLMSPGWKFDVQFANAKRSHLQAGFVRGGYLLARRETLGADAGRAVQVMVVVTTLDMEMVTLRPSGS